MCVCIQLPAPPHDTTFCMLTQMGQMHASLQVSEHARTAAPCAPGPSAASVCPPAKSLPGGGGMKMVEPDALLLLLSTCFSARFCSSLAAESRSARTCGGVHKHSGSKEQQQQQWQSES
jgi:hypothetical protein